MENRQKTRTGSLYKSRGNEISSAPIPGIHTLSPSLRAVISFFSESAVASRGQNNFTHLKLQVLLYYAQGFHLGRVYRPIFPENIEAWPQGPVVRPVWVVFQNYTVLPIRQIIVPVGGVFNDYQTVLLQWIYSRIGRLDGESLADRASQESPYIQSYVSEYGAVIPQPKMRRHFETASL